MPVAYSSIFNSGNTYGFATNASGEGFAVKAGSTTNSFYQNYPLTINSSSNTSLISVVGGKGYVPIVFSGLSNVDNPKFWQSTGNAWTLIDQPNYGKDFWQTEYNNETGLFDLIYNVNQDTKDDGVANFSYYLGENPPNITSKSGSKIEDSKIKVYPNPAHVRIIIFSQKELIKTVRFYNLLGIAFG